MSSAEFEGKQHCGMRVCGLVLCYFMLMTAVDVVLRSEEEDVSEGQRVKNRSTSAYAGGE